MPSLYKYLPSKFSHAFLNRGEILFRNLTYFRQLEGKVRGDAYEGIHNDYPGTDVTLKNLTQGFSSVGKFSFLSSTNSDFVFAFCLSRRLNKELMDEFNCDVCIEIFEPEEFIKRLRFALIRLISVHKTGLLAQPVHYYNPSSLVLFDIKDPTQLVFAKNDFYAKQDEFRLSFGTRQAFKLIEQVAFPNHNPYDEAIKGVCKEKLIRIGQVNDIARLIQL